MWTPMGKGATRILITDLHFYLKSVRIYSHQTMTKILLCQWYAFVYVQRVWRPPKSCYSVAENAEKCTK